MFEQEQVVRQSSFDLKDDCKLNLCFNTLNIFYCSKRQKDKTQVKQLRQSSPITYISKYTIEHNNK
jgi:hypothetical protein